MNKKVYFIGTFLLLIVLFLSLLFCKVFYENKLKLEQALYNSKSATVLYALDTNKTHSAHKILKHDLVQLIHDYDKELFSRSKVLSSICKDWKIYMKRVISEHINDNEYQGYIDTDYYKKVKINMEILNSECKGN